MPYANSSDVKIYWEDQGEGALGAQASLPASLRTDDDPSHATPGRQGCLRSQGDPVLLIMGLGYTMDMWYRTAPVLSQRYRTISFDNRGVGRSDVPPGPYSIAAMAADAAAVLDSAGVTRAHVFGISMGGMIAQEFALRYPQRTRSLILGCTSHGGPQAVLADAEVINTVMARGTMSVEDGIRAMIPFIYDRSTPRERIEEDLEIRRRTFPTAQGYFAQVQGIFVYESLSRLSQLKVPTLVVHGESDRLVPPENGRRLARLIAGARLVMIPNASHIFPTDQPDTANEAILGFLAEQASDIPADSEAQSDQSNNPQPKCV